MRAGKLAAYNPAMSEFKAFYFQVLLLVRQVILRPLQEGVSKC